MMKVCKFCKITAGTHLQAERIFGMILKNKKKYVQSVCKQCRNKKQRQRNK